MKFYMRRTKPLFVITVLIYCGIISCTTESSDNSSNDYSENNHEESKQEEVTNYSSGSHYTNSSKKIYHKEDYANYPKIVLHSSTEINKEDDKDVSQSIKNSIEALEDKGKNNPEFIQWYFISIKYEEGYGSKKQSILYTDLIECHNRECDPENLIRLKDQTAEFNLLPGQTQLGYKIHVLDGTYSYASDMRLEVVNSNDL